MLTAIQFLKLTPQAGPFAKLTPLGHHLSKLPVDPHVGKMLIYGIFLFTRKSHPLDTRNVLSEGHHLTKNTKDTL